MRVNCSAAEEKVAVGLQERGVKGWFKDVEIILDSTVPDFSNLIKGVVVYLDGEEVHSSENAQLRDERIDDKLARKGIRVMRFRYRPPLSQKRLNEILLVIEEVSK
jgi:very-short-patch-repair endonuclease